MSQPSLILPKDKVKHLLKFFPEAYNLQLFKDNLHYYLESIDTSKDEEHNKTILRDFLKNSLYNSEHFINTSDRKDLVIHEGKKSDSNISVIIETKSPANKHEMCSVSNINTKALQELVLYYLRERITKKNLAVKHLIVTNFTEWFVFDAALFDKLFADDKSFIKDFQDFENGILSVTTTDKFYSEIAKPKIEAVVGKIEYVYFDIRDFRNASDRKILMLYRLLSPQNILKLPFINDSNTLDKDFYNELLHIIGLTENKKSGKKIIQRKKEGQRESGTILEETIIQLDSLNSLTRFDRVSQYGESEDDQLFSIALELCITWINRILFLKLLESQLISFNRSSDPNDKTWKKFAFLNTSKIKSYTQLNTLFFQVLAVIKSDRNDDVDGLFSHVPYLNSSLFEPQEIEYKSIVISNLDSYKEISPYSKTILKDTNGKRETGRQNTLEYLFRFLDAYDYSGETENIEEKSGKSLINASVLGLIFEKINGYKDGSFFTPGFITMYMCRETIRRALVQKFNDEYGWECKGFNELYDKIDDKSRANEIVNSLKICDPAVGSGHFLVSALNEIIAIKHELGILRDSSGRSLRDYDIQVINDELVITNDDGELFKYRPNNSESQRVQETLFHEKQTIIENCLFGVDININSVKICRLRLWIELLKHAYYNTTTGELETLPNIDINIKHGNSLISHVNLKGRDSVRNLNIVEKYKEAVKDYKATRGRAAKREITKKIEYYKNEIQSIFDRVSPSQKKYNELKDQLKKLTDQDTIGGKNDDEIDRLRRLLEKVENDIKEQEESRRNHRPFEWRFEFPEVLNDEGDYVGFDVVIGNPPYGVEISYKNTYYSDSYIAFYLLALDVSKFKGIISMITPDSWLINNNGYMLRKSFTDNGGVHSIRDVYKVFKDAPDVWCIIVVFEKNVNVLNTEISRDEPYDHEIFQFEIPWHSFNSSNGSPWFIYINSDFKKIFKKMNNQDKIELYFHVNRGFSPSPNITNVVDRITDRQVIGGEDFGKYYSKINPKYLINDYTKSRDSINNVLKSDFIAIQRIRTNKIDMKSSWLVCQYFEKGFVPIDSVSYLRDKGNITLYFLLGILNSYLLNIYYKLHYTDKNVKPIYLKGLPIPKNLSQEQQQPIIDLVDKVLSAKKENPDADTTAWEKEIDQLVYQLYDLTAEEIEIVESV